MRTPTKQEKKKDKNWGVWPNFRYYKGRKGKIRKPKPDKTKEKEEERSKPLPPPSGYEGVYWSQMREGWFGIYRFWKGGKHKNGRVTKARTDFYDTPKEAYDAMCKV